MQALQGMGTAEDCRGPGNCRGKGDCRRTEDCRDCRGQDGQEVRGKGGSGAESLPASVRSPCWTAPALIHFI